jgi:hypothetical protein
MEASILTLTGILQVFRDFIELFRKISKHGCKLFIKPIFDFGEFDVGTGFGQRAEGGGSEAEGGEKCLTNRSRSATPSPSR